MNRMEDTSNSGYSYPERVWIQAGIYALIVVVLLLVEATFNVLLLILAGCLIAIFFRALADLVRRTTKLNRGLSLTIAILSTLLIIIGLLWLIGAKVQYQLQELTDTLPQMVDHAKKRLSESAVGHQIVEGVSAPGSAEKVRVIAGTFFRSSFGVLGDIYVVLFIGIFLTVSPQVYTHGLIRIIPKGARPKGASVLQLTGEKLRKWLKGKLIAMVIVFVLTTTALLLLGVPMWLSLAIIAGLLNFIPNFGPLLAMIPAVLVALMISPATALIVAGAYIIIQMVESNLITPMVQKKLVNIPPALIIIAQLLVAPLTGGWGLLLATPLVLIIRTVVQELYIREQEKS